MRLIGSTEQIVAKDKNPENVSKLEIVDCNVVNNSYQETTIALFMFVPIQNLGN